jgi:hypothetical protein
MAWSREDRKRDFLLTVARTIHKNYRVKVARGVYEWPEAVQRGLERALGYQHQLFPGDFTPEDRAGLVRAVEAKEREFLRKTTPLEGGPGREHHSRDDVPEAGRRILRKGEPFS